MRTHSDSPVPAYPDLRPLALVVAPVALPLWEVAGLALGLTLLVPVLLILALTGTLSLMLAPLVLRCQSCPGWRWGWLCRPEWLLELWSWHGRCLLRWPWLYWRWLRYPWNYDVKR